MYKSIIKKKKKNHGDITLLAKTNLDCIKGSISSCLINSYVEKDYFILISVLREYDNSEKKSMNLNLHKLIKNLNIFLKQRHCVEKNVE